MASELKLCPFCSSTNVDLANTWTPSFWVECNECGAQVHGDSFEGPDRKDRFSYSKEPTSTFEATLDQLYPEYQAAAQSAIDRWNTRPAPAATDTGLERYDMSMFGNGIVEMGGGAYVRFDQADELLAAERAEKGKLEAAWLEAEGKISDLKSDNAAKDARIKEWEKADRLVSAALWEKKVEVLEAKLAVAEQQLRGIVTAWESLPGGRNYSTGEVQDWLLGPMQKAINRIRAVLGGKPS